MRVFCHLGRYAAPVRRISTIAGSPRAMARADFVVKPGVPVPRSGLGDVETGGCLFLRDQLGRTLKPTFRPEFQPLKCRAQFEDSRLLLARRRSLLDSPLEGTGFEPSVPLW